MTSSQTERTDRVAQPGRIRVHLNGKEREIPAELSVRELLEHLDLDPSVVVVELNREILGREQYDDRTVREDDTVELVHFVGGG